MEIQNYISVKNKVSIPHQLVYHTTLHSVNYPNHSVISTPQCNITHYTFLQCIYIAIDAMYETTKYDFLLLYK